MLFNFRPKSRIGCEIDQTSELIEGMRAVLAARFDNPERLGCPSQELLQKIANSASPEMLRLWSRHLSTCGECYRDFNKLRSSSGSVLHKLRRVLQRIMRKNQNKAHILLTIFALSLLIIK